MATLKSQVARCLRRYNYENMMILADMLEERELFEAARVIRHDGKFLAFHTLYQLRNYMIPVRLRQGHLQTRSRGMTISRFKKWSNEPANSRISEIIVSDTVAGYSEPIAIESEDNSRITTPTFLEPITFGSYNIQRRLPDTAEDE